MNQTQFIAFIIDHIFLLMAGGVLILFGLGVIPVSKEKEKQEEFMKKKSRAIILLGVILIVIKIIDLLIRYLPYISLVNK